MASFGAEVVGDAGKRIRAVGRTTGGVSEKAIRKGAQVVKADALATIGAATHGSFELRGMRSRSGRPARLGARVTVIGKGPATEAIIRATGPWWLIEREVSPHWVGTRLEDRTGEAPHMRLPGSENGWGTGPWFGSHSEGKHPWAASWKKSKPKVARLWRADVDRHILSNF